MSAAEEVAARSPSATATAHVHAQSLLRRHVALPFWEEPLIATEQQDVGEHGSRRADCEGQTSRRRPDAPAIAQNWSPEMPAD